MSCVKLNPTSFRSRDESFLLLLGVIFQVPARNPSRFWIPNKLRAFGIVSCFLSQVYSNVYIPVMDFCHLLLQASIANVHMRMRVDKNRPVYFRRTSR